MRIVLCLALLMMMGALLLSTSTRPVGGCTDWDEDGVCAGVDCNDSNPTINYDGDADGDGFTVCQGDCMDEDPSIHKCGETHKQYPIIYNPPEQPCKQGYTITTKLYRCWYDSNGVFLGCESQPYYQYDTNYLRDCFPYG
jgi:hypothetical protein